MTLDEFNQTEVPKIEEILEKKFPHKKVEDLSGWTWQWGWIVSAYKNEEENIVKIFLQESQDFGDREVVTTFAANPGIDPFHDWSEKDTIEMANKMGEIIKKRKEKYGY